MAALWLDATGAESLPFEIIPNGEPNARSPGVSG